LAKTLAQAVVTSRIEFEVDEKPMSRPYNMSELTRLKSYQCGIYLKCFGGLEGSETDSCPIRMKKQTAVEIYPGHRSLRPIYSSFESLLTQCKSSITHRCLAVDKKSGTHYIDFQCPARRRTLKVSAAFFVQDEGAHP
jgi:hypothetical protein